VQISNQCLLEDDLDDIAAFPIFTKQTSRRLRRTSIKIYRESLHDAEDMAVEEQCDTASVCENMENETTTADVEMNSTTTDVSFDDLVQLPTASTHSLTLPTNDVQNVDMRSDVQTAELPSVTNSNSVVNPKTGISNDVIIYHFCITITRHFLVDIGV